MLSFYSPTNGLLINHDGDQRVLLPHVELMSLRPELKALNDSYETYWSKAFQLLGWRPSMIEATTLGRYLGLIHCVTAALPNLPLKLEWLKALKIRQEREFNLTSPYQKSMIRARTDQLATPRKALTRISSNEEDQRRDSLKSARPSKRSRGE